MADERGDLDEAERHAEESLAIAREINDREGIAYALSCLGGVARKAGALAESRGYLEEARGHLIELGDKVHIAEWLEICAPLNLAEGDAPRAARMLGAAQALREQIDAPRPPNQQPGVEDLTSALRKALGADDLDRALGEGRTVGWQALIEGSPEA